MANYADALESNAAMRRGRDKKPVLAHIRVEKAKNGGHIVEHHYESGTSMGGYHEPESHVFAEPTGTKPALPEGHLLHHIAKHLGIPHEVMGKTHGEQSQEPETEADED